MRAVTVGDVLGRKRLMIGTFDPPKPATDEVTVEVKAISLNNGEVRGAFSAPAGYRPGWDLAGVVQAAPPGSVFSVGDRVFGLKFEGAWAEQVVMAASFLARIPPETNFEEAAALPVTGLTASVALSKKRPGPGDKVLVTAATGGVGLLAVQLAAAEGAHVTAFVRDEADAPLLRRVGAHAVADGPEEAARLGPFDLILEGVGGRLLGSALSWLRPRGVCVQFGDAGGDEPTTFDAKRFRLGDGNAFGGTSLYGLFLIEELTRPNPASASLLLADLVSRVGSGTLDPMINRTGSWRDIDDVARSLLERSFKGKAVLTVD